MKKADDDLPHFTDGKSRPIALIGLVNIRITEKDPEFLFLTQSAHLDSHQILLMSFQCPRQLRTTLGTQPPDSLIIFNLHLTVT